MFSRSVIDYLIKPILAKKLLLTTVFFSLILASISQGIILFSLKPFLSGLLGIHSGINEIELSQIFHPKAVALFPFLAKQVFSRQELILAIPIVIALGGIIRGLAIYLYQFSQQKIVLQVCLKLREELFSALVKLPYLEVKRKDPSAWMSTIVNDVQVIQGRLSELMRAAMLDLVLTASAVFYMFFIDYRFAIALIALSPFLGLYMTRVGSKVSSFTEEFQNQLALISRSLLEMRARFGFIKSQNGVRFELSKFYSFNKNYFDTMKKSLLIRATFAPFLEFIMALVIVAIFVALANKWLHFTSVELITFLGALGLIIKNIKNIAIQVSNFGETKGALVVPMKLISKANEKILQGKPLISDSSKEGGSVLPEAIHIKHVEISVDQKTILNIKDLEIHRGRKIAIIGPTGSGKSTMIKVLAGILQPNLWDADVEWARVCQATSFVSQDPFLFQDSLANNIFYQNDKLYEIESSTVLSTLQSVGLGQRLQNLDLNSFKFNPINSEFSGGELQRLVIARALLRKDKSIFIFDEATSAIDGKLEKQIIDYIFSIIDAHKCLLYITHRLEHLAKFDEVWFMDSGCVAMKGNHLSLLDNLRYKQYCGK